MTDTGAPSSGVEPSAFGGGVIFPGHEHEEPVNKTGNAAVPARFTVSKANNIAWGATLGASWFWTCKHLSLAWSSYPNYKFGYFVPWIVILLALRRIRATPGCLEPVPPSQRATRFIPGAGIVVAWGLFLFAELVRQFDPHWRMVSWMMIGSVTLLTWIWLWRRSGEKLLGTLAFPLGFAWTAVPWPTRLEEIVTLNLRAFVTKATVAALHSRGITALQHGNIIDLAKGSVVVDSACSGISSLQVSIMASLFLGEFFRFGVGKRFLLLAAGSLVAVAGNLVRTTILVWLANHWGADVMLKYHDRLGYAESAGIFLALVLMAWCVYLKSSARSRESIRPGSLADTVQGARVPHDPQLSACPGIRAGNEGWAGLLAFASLPFITSTWFALSPGGPIRTQDAPLWLLKANPLAADWHVQPVTLSPMDIRTLDFTEGQTICVAGPLETSAVIYHFFWKTDASTGYGHTPDACMVGAGWEEKEDPVPITMRIKNTAFPGKLYRFKRDGEEEVVFQSIWYGGDPLLSVNDFPLYTKGWPRTSRLALLWKEPRRRGLESLNIYMPVVGDRETQTRAAEEILAQVLVPNPGE